MESFQSVTFAVLPLMIFIKGSQSVRGFHFVSSYSDAVRCEDEVLKNYFCGARRLFDGPYIMVRWYSR